MQTRNRWLVSVATLSVAALAFVLSATPTQHDAGASLGLNKGQRANVRVELIGPDGRVKLVRETHNLVVNAGKDGAVARIIDGTSTPAIFNYIAIGEGTPAGTCGAAAAGNTALEGEVGTRQQDTDSAAGATGVSSLVVTFAAGNGTGSICEVGVFNASTGPTMLARNTFGVITKGAGDSLQVTFELTVS